MNARVATALTAAGVLSMTMIAATKAPASAPSQPDPKLAMTVATILASHAQHRFILGLAAGRPGS